MIHYITTPDAFIQSGLKSYTTYAIFNAQIVQQILEHVSRAWTTVFTEI